MKRLSRVTHAVDHGVDRRVTHGVSRRIKDVALVLLTMTLVSLAILMWQFNIGVATIVSESMSPALRSGDVVITLQVSRDEVRVGDVLVLPHPNDESLRLAHRVVSVERLPWESVRMESRETGMSSPSSSPSTNPPRESSRDTHGRSSSTLTGDFSTFRILIETKGDANPVKDDWVLELKSGKVPRIEFVVPTSSLPLSGTQHIVLGQWLLGVAGFAIVMAIIQERRRIRRLS
jgi:signal peptidase I